MYRLVLSLVFALVLNVVFLSIDHNPVLAARAVSKKVNPGNRKIETVASNRTTKAQRSSKAIVMSQRKNAAAVAFVTSAIAARNQERQHRNNNNIELCPSQYASVCVCDFMSPDQLNNRYDQQYYYDDELRAMNGGGKSTSVRVGKSTTTHSVLIDCQFNNAETRQSSPSGGANGSDDGSMLKVIPKLIVRGSPASSMIMANISKQFKHITHLDLSRTSISLVPTDAFLGLSGLQAIAITHCKNLTKIQMFAFRGLPNLKTLIVSNNPNLIQLEPYSFGGLYNLNYLSLGMNQLSEIEGYIFSASTSIRLIDFIGNPIKRIKSHAFHGLRNVSELLLSLKEKKTPIEHIEDDSFITTAFIDTIYLEGIGARHLVTHAFRGLSHCKMLLLSHSHIETVHAGAFMRANNIKRVSLMNSRVRNISVDAFRGVFNVDTIDLRANYLTRVERDTFESLLLQQPPVQSDFYQQMHYDSQPSTMLTTSVVFIDTASSSSSSSPSTRMHSYVVRKILFEQNPIQCDCGIKWLLVNPIYRGAVSLPELCAGPKGFDCLRISELNTGELICPNSTLIKSQQTLPCDDLVFDVDKNTEIYSISVPKGKKKIFLNDSIDSDDDDDDDEEENLEKYNTSSSFASNKTWPSFSSPIKLTTKEIGLPSNVTNRIVKNPLTLKSDGSETASTTAIASVVNKSTSLRFFSLNNSVIKVSLFLSFRLFLYYFFMYETFLCI